MTSRALISKSHCTLSANQKRDSEFNVYWCKLLLTRIDMYVLPLAVVTTFGTSKFLKGAHPWQYLPCHQPPTSTPTTWILKLDQWCKSPSFNPHIIVSRYDSNTVNLPNPEQGFIVNGAQDKYSTGCEDNFAWLVWPSSRKFFLQRSSVLIVLPTGMKISYPPAENINEPMPELVPYIFYLSKTWNICTQSNNLKHDTWTFTLFATVCNISIDFDQSSFEVLSKITLH